MILLVLLLLFDQEQWDLLDTLDAPEAAVQFAVWELNKKLKGIQLEFRRAK